MFQNFLQKAQQLIDPAVLPGPLGSSSSGRPSKAQLFRHQFRLPETQNPLYEITAELTLPSKRKGSVSKASPGSWDKSNWDRDRGTHYVGQLHLSEQFLCFSTVQTSFVSTASTAASSAFTGRTHGTGPAGNGFTLPLCAVRRVERLHTQSYMFALSITTWNGFEPGGDGKPGAPSYISPLQVLLAAVIIMINAIISITMRLGIHYSLLIGAVRCLSLLLFLSWSSVQSPPFPNTIFSRTGQVTGFIR